MSTRTTILLTILLIGAAALISAVLFPHLPETMASHWDANGAVNGYMSRFWGVALMPLVSLGLAVLFLLIPKIDPLKANIAQFSEMYNAFIVLFIAFLLYLHLITLIWNLGARFNISLAMLPAMGLLFTFLGILLGRAKRNFFIGIRTPWTLASDAVWEKTHRVGARLFQIAGLLILLTAFLKEAGVWIMLAVILVVVLVPVIYSYFVYRREEQPGSK
jgi:uncharacterized membrane protein